MPFDCKVSGDARVLDIIRVRSGVLSKRFLIEEIYDVTGIRLHKSTVYRYQQRLGLI